MELQMLHGVPTALTDAPSAASFFSTPEAPSAANADVFQPLHSVQLRQNSPAWLTLAKLHFA
jgi:hypothetical protein